MNFILDNLLLLSVAATSGGLLLWPAIKGATASGLTPEAAVQRINRDKAVVIDVSEPEEFAKCRISQSKNVPFGQVEDKLTGVVKNKALPVILVCPTGARANRVLATVKKLGYEQAQTLSGGINAWKAANLPVTKDSPKDDAKKA